MREVRVTCYWWTLEQLHIKEMYSNTYTDIVPNIITGFRPYRSAIIPHSTEVKALPNIKADPSGDEWWNENWGAQTRYLCKQAEYKSYVKDSLTHITSIVANVLLSFCNVEVPYLQKTNLQDHHISTSEEHERRTDWQIHYHWDLSWSRP